MKLFERILAGDIRSIGRAVTLLENGHPDKEDLIDALYPHCGRAVVLGLTGPPGAGKSSLADRMISAARAEGNKVAVIAVDPSSPFSGGAILGDRLRMQKHAVDEGVFIRSMASRGHLGGVAGATGDAIKVFDAAGYDLIILETIGVGQTEIEVMEWSDIVLLVLVPGLGDEIQALKAGIMEIGDIFVINKSDRDDADKLKAEVEYVLSIKYHDRPEGRNPIVKTSATEGTGIQELMGAVDGYLKNIRQSGQLEVRHRARIAGQIKKIMTARILAGIEKRLQSNHEIEEMVDRIFNKSSRPYSLIYKKLDSLLKEHDWE